MSKKNLVYFLGTKAQFIKTIPIINATDETKFNINFLDTCQHYDISRDLIKKINKKINYIQLSDNKKSAQSRSLLILWFLKLSIKIIFSNKTKFKNLNTACLVHGNTLSTILGVLWAKRNNLKLVHIEGGYRSFNWLKPFPEEIIRYFTSKVSNYIICFDETSKINLVNMKVKGEIIQVSRNTIIDSLNLDNNDVYVEQKLTVSIHRNENIFIRKKLKEIVTLLIKLRKDHFEEINWYLHPQTKKALKKNKLINNLTSNKIVLVDLLPHTDFLNEINSSGCVITDGESVIEECKLLGVPTYALIDKLENVNADGNNIYLQDKENNSNFFDNFTNFREKKITKTSISPSKEILDYIETNLFN